MSEGKSERDVIADRPKPGTGVDRTLIHRLLVLTPAERVRMLVAEARNVEELLSRVRRR